MFRQKRLLRRRCDRSAVGHFEFRFYVAGGVLVARSPSPRRLVHPFLCVRVTTRSNVGGERRKQQQQQYRRLAQSVMSGLITARPRTTL